MGRFFSDIKFALGTSAAARCLPPCGRLAGPGHRRHHRDLYACRPLLLRLLPVKNPQQLVLISSTGPHMGNNRGPRARPPTRCTRISSGRPPSPTFSAASTPLSVSFNGHTERVNGELVSGNYFQALGVRSAIGQVFSPEQDDRTYEGHPSWC